MLQRLAALLVRGRAAGSLCCFGSSTIGYQLQIHRSLHISLTTLLFVSPTPCHPLQATRATMMPTRGRLCCCSCY